jgi:hypothetical protein
MPQVWQSRPDVRLLVVGKNPPRSLLAYSARTHRRVSPAGVEITGNLWRLVHEQHGKARIVLIAGERLMPSAPDKVRRLAKASLTTRGVDVIEGALVNSVEQGLVEFRPGAPASDAQPQRLWTLTERMGFHKAPGVSIAVINDNSIEWTQGYGLLKAGTSNAVTPDSLFEAASTSKVVTAVLVMHFVETGTLDLDRNVNDYLKSSSR